jgi:hypothetical protein
MRPCQNIPAGEMATCGAVSVTAHVVDNTEAMMAKLTDTQLIVLSKAVQRNDGCAQLPDGISKSAARKLGAALVAKKLMREVHSKPGMPVWRGDQEDRPVSLVILKAGRDAIGVDEDTAPPATKAAAKAGPVTEPGKGGMAKSTGLSDGEAVAASVSGSKRSQVIGMLSAPAGATVTELVAATSWLPHTTRAFLTGLRKEGFAVERQRSQGAAVSTYRIVAARLSKAG